jgi:hypothetical protein
MPNPEVSNARGIAKHARYGGLLGSYRIYKRGIVADETPPTDEREGTVIGDRFEECLWAIEMPPGIVTYDVHILRWIIAVDANGNPVDAGYWSEEDTYTATANSTAFQYVCGDRLALYIDATAGVFGPGFIIRRKGVNKHA